jgi:CRISPR-associated endoribonuclease Cas2 subtype I-E
MLLMIGERLPNKLHGYLSQMLLEVQPQTFVGVVSARVREQLIAEVKRQLGPFGAMTIISSSKNEQGFVVRVFGQTTFTPLDLDGIQVMARRNAG